MRTIVLIAILSVIVAGCNGNTAKSPEKTGKSPAAGNAPAKPAGDAVPKANDHGSAKPQREALPEPTDDPIENKNQPVAKEQPVAAPAPVAGADKPEPQAKAGIFGAMGSALKKGVGQGMK